MSLRTDITYTFFHSSLCALLITGSYFVCCQDFRQPIPSLVLLGPSCSVTLRGLLLPLPYLGGLERGQAPLDCNPEEVANCPDSPQISGGSLFQINSKIASQKALQL